MPKAVNWIENNFFIPETRHDNHLHGRISLQPYQRDVLHEALTPGPDGRYKYSIIIWSDIKKSAKSTVAAAVNLYRCSFSEYGEYYVVANDLKQADSRVAHYIRRAVELNPNMRKKYKQQGYRITAPSGSFIEAIPIDPSGEAGTNADQVTFCLDQETEVLTKEGWKNWETLTKYNQIATRSPEGVFEWQFPDNIYCASYSGTMVGISHRSIDMLVTPDHRVYGRFIGGRGIASGVNNCDSRTFVDELENRFIDAKTASRTRGYFPVITSEWPDGETGSFEIPATNGRKKAYRKPSKIVSPELYCEFVGWFLSEGYAKSNKREVEGFSIAQSKEKNPENYERIFHLLKAMGFDARTWKDEKEISVYHPVFAKTLHRYGLSPEKYIPSEIKNLPRRYLEIFLNTYIKGDGSKVSTYGYVIASRSKNMRDDLIEVAQKCGYSVSSYEQTDYRWKNNPVMYCVYLRSKNAFRTTRVSKRNWYETNYSGMVFCPSTENGVIYVRRNGTYYWTGNSELWGAHEEDKQKMWSEMTIPPAKHGHAFRWIESYAGFSEESDLLYSLYELGVKQGELLWPDRLYNVTEGSPTPLELYVNKAAGMLCMWNTQPRCPWHTKAYYGEEEKILPPNQFLRIHRNQWVSNTETFVPMPWVYACQRSNEDWPQVDERQAVVVAMDAATSNDCFAIYAGCRHPDKPGDILTLYARKWSPNHNSGKIDFQGNEFSPGPEMELRRLIETYNVVQVTFDPYQLHDLSTRLKQEGLAWFKAFNQGTDRLIADSQFRDLIRDRRFWYRNESDLVEHLQNANAKIDENDSKVRIVKRVDRLKIDLAVAASMACHNLLYLNL